MASQSVEDVCDELGIDPDTLEPAAEFVADRKAFAEGLRTVETSTLLPNSESVHLHQRVWSGKHEYCVTNIANDSVTLTEISVPDEDSDMVFRESIAVTYGEICMDYELQTATDGTTPEFAY